MRVSAAPAAPSCPHAPPPAPTRFAPCPPARRLQIVVLDKLDYCATLNNLASVRAHPNFK